jgi:hypothetical protein
MERQSTTKQFHSRAAIEAMCLSIVRDQAACRDLKRVMIRGLHPQGNGPNWEVERFEPPLATTSEEIARHVIKRLQDEVALGSA